MAIGATIYHFVIDLSDVDRGVYTSLDLRLARHPSESLKYLLTRTLAYCLCFEPGIEFSKGGLSDPDEPPVSLRAADGRWMLWVDVGAPSARRLHKASKSAARVVLFSHVELALLLKEARSLEIHHLADIEVWLLDTGFLASVSERLERKLSLSLTRSGGALYLELAGNTFHTVLQPARLSDP